jgi:blue copper oxidase
LITVSPVRRVLVFGLVAVVLVCAGGAALIGWQLSRAAISTAGEVDFVHPLAIPPLAPSRLDGAGRRVFDLRAAEGGHDFGDGAVQTWGFNGDYLGPTLRAARGEHVVVNVRNDVPEATTVHWHGMHLPARMDGGPHQTIQPGQTWSPTWTVNQPAATLWYHPHPHGETARHLYRGLAGMFIVDDPATDVAALPHDYGVDDFPIIVQDKRFTRDGRLDSSGSLLGGVGILGDTVAVNGTVGPYLDVTTERVRLRLLNGSNARVYDFGFADDRSFALVGTDGGLLPSAHETNRIMLSPGERAEIVVAVRPGERAVLRSTPPRAGLNALTKRFSGGSDTLDILELRAAGELASRPAVPPKLVAITRLDPGQAAQTRDFRLTSERINGRSMDMSRVDATVEKDTVEVWRITNEDGIPHSFHVHNVQFQVHTVDRRAAPPHLGGWKDTVYLPPHQPVEIIVRFADYTDPSTPYMFHCHVLRHEDQGMMGQFVVVEPGQRAAITGAGHHHGHGQ